MTGHVPSIPILFNNIFHHGLYLRKKIETIEFIPPYLPTVPVSEKKKLLLLRRFFSPSFSVFGIGLSSINKSAADRYYYCRCYFLLLPFLPFLYSMRFFIFYNNTRLVLSNPSTLLSALSLSLPHFLIISIKLIIANNNKQTTTEISNHKTCWWWFIW